MLMEICRNRKAKQNDSIYTCMRFSRLNEAQDARAVVSVGCA